MPLNPYGEEVFRSQLLLDDAAVERLLALIAQARKDLWARIATANPHSHTPAVLRQAETALGEVFDSLRLGMHRSLHADLLTSVDMGIALTDTGLPKTAAVMGSGFHMPAEFLTAVEQFSATKVVQITEEVRGQIDSALKLGLLGGKTVSQTAADLQLTSLDKGPWKTLETRAEVVARTELNRAGNMSSFARLENAAKTIPGMQKEWLSAGDARVRETHQAANGQIRDVGKTFTVGGHAARYPHDPLLPAGEVVNCRCRVLPKVPPAAEEEVPEVALPHD